MKTQISNLKQAEHLKKFPDHQFEWKVLTRAPEYMRKRKILEALHGDLY